MQLFACKSASVFLGYLEGFSKRSPTSCVSGNDAEEALPYQFLHLAGRHAHGDCLRRVDLTSAGVIAWEEFSSANRDSPTGDDNSLMRMPHCAVLSFEAVACRRFHICIGTKASLHISSRR